MACPTSWQAFRKKYIDVARHGDYQSALREVSAGWADAKALRYATPRVPGWRTVAHTQMQTRIDNDVQRRAAEQDRLDAAQREAEGVTMLLNRHNQVDTSANSQWRGGWQIGGREPNTVNIWLRVDAQGIVVDRRVVKTTQVVLGQWVDFTRWSGPDVRDLENREHVDYTIHKRLCEVPDGGENFVCARGYRNITAQYGYRVVFDYCDGGDLMRLRERHPDGVPEPLIWRILEHLAKSAIVMQQGSLADPVPGWQQIIHGDFKPTNVFLTASSTPGEIYPDAKLGDFELAVQTSDVDPFNPVVLRAISGGDPGWEAPEKRLHDSRWMCIKVAGRDVAYLDNEQLLAPMNIWGIGVCIYDLMNGQVDIQYYAGDPEDQTDFEIVPYSDVAMKIQDPFFDQWEPAALGKYSNHLVQTVRRCLADLPSDRITPNELLALINDPVPDADDGDDYDTPDDRLRAGSAKAARDGMSVGEEWPAFIDSEDLYRMGLTFQDVVRSTAEAPNADDDSLEDGEIAEP